MRSIIRIFICSLPLLLFSCYKFQGISISPEIRTYYVSQFGDKTRNSPPGLTIDFTEKLKDKIRDESRLVYSEVAPDVTFSGDISSFRVSFGNIQANEQVAFNRLIIGAKVNYENSLNEEDNLDFSVEFDAQYSSDQNLLDVQDELIEEITNQLVDEIFNKAFTNW